MACLLFILFNNTEIVSTNYWIDSTIYHQSNNTAIDWDASYADTTSLNYATLSKRYCDLVSVSIVFLLLICLFK